MGDEAFERLLARTRAEVEAWLAPWTAARVAEAAARGEGPAAVASAARELVLRGGKRVRAGLLALTYEACGGSGGSAAVVAAAGALELFQGYLLTHDDWMDGDAMRRGGPSVPALMRERFGASGDAMSILAGDLLSGWSQRALLEVDRPAPLVLGAARELAQAHDDVVQGQVLDVHGKAASAAEVHAVHALKTASYTTRAPVTMGARLAGASEARVAALSAFATPAGVAFQLRDDLLGVFGEARATGKGVGGDVRAGKRTALVLDGLANGDAAPVLRAVLGVADASEADVKAATAALEASGARRRVEESIAGLVVEARRALGSADLGAEGTTLLEGALVALTQRDR